MHLLFRETLGWFAFYRLGFGARFVTGPQSSSRQAEEAAQPPPLSGPSVLRHRGLGSSRVRGSVTVRQPRGGASRPSALLTLAIQRVGAVTLRGFENEAAEAQRGQVPGMPPRW